MAAYDYRLLALIGLFGHRPEWTKLPYINGQVDTRDRMIGPPAKGKKTSAYTLSLMMTKIE